MTFFCSACDDLTNFISLSLFSSVSTVHLQILLAVGLAVFCYCLVLGCVFCCRRRKSVSSEDKEAVFLSPHPAERVTVTLTPSPCTQPVKQQYEELDGDVLEFPSSKSSSSPSEDDVTALPSDPSPTRSTELVQSRGSSYPTRRLSSPAVPCLPRKSQSHGRASLPSLTKLSLVSKSCRAMGRRSTVSSESFLYSESSRLTAAAAAAAAPTLQGQHCLSQYGSNSLSIPTKPALLLHFTPALLLRLRPPGRQHPGALRGQSQTQWGVCSSQPPSPPPLPSADSLSAPQPQPRPPHSELCAAGGLCGGAPHLHPEAGRLQQGLLRPKRGCPGGGGAALWGDGLGAWHHHHSHQAAQPN